MREGKTGDGDPEWRTGHVVEPGAVEEFHGIRIAAVLAADADLEFLVCLTTTFDAYFNKLAHAFLIKAGEWVVVKNFLILVGWKETGRVIPGKTQSGLREIH